MVVRSGYMFGPGNRRSLRDAPLDDFAEASKTARSLVVQDESLETPWIGR